MEAAPPSYDEATLVDYWDLIARYLPSNDLCSAALVCSRWHSTFAPHLWGNPASHFGIENDHVYVALTKFKRTLQTARLLVRSLTHTVHLPPAHAELYYGPHADWLRNLLDRLPNLQSLIVRGLPFFDHSALQALRYKPATARSENAQTNGAIELPGSLGYSSHAPSNAIPSFGVRLLDASRCPNVTSGTLAQAMSRFESIVYLDLSFTYAARDVAVLATLRRFSGLQILKLRGINLTDQALCVLGSAIGLRVRSLDVRDNALTNAALKTLLVECFTGGALEHPAMGSTNRSESLLPYMGTEMLNVYQGEDFESFIRSTFTTSFVNRLATEDAPQGGITHLYIAGNSLSVEGVLTVLETGRLHILDVQDVTRSAGQHLATPTRELGDQDLIGSGIVKLVDALANSAHASLKFLRIDHDVITSETSRAPQDDIDQVCFELADTALPVIPKHSAELGGVSVRPPAFEVSSNQTPRYELEDPMAFAGSSVSSSKKQDPARAESPLNEIRRGSVFAPEAVDAGDVRIDHASLLSPVSPLHGSALPGLGDTSGPVSPFADGLLSPFNSGLSSNAARPRTYSTAANEREARLRGHRLHNSTLHPAMLPALRTLVLTDVPSTTLDEEVSSRLIRFIHQCATETWHAKTRAKLDYTIPPGRSGHTAALERSADRIFAMKRIVLELAPERPSQRNGQASPWHHWNTKSMTGDRDSEALWSASETDFSFFGSEGEDLFPSLEAAVSPLPSWKEVCSGQEPASRSSQSKAAVEQKIYDTVALISAFRKERRLAHQRAVDEAGGLVELQTEGYWEGVVQVVRPGSGMRADEEVDYYGNRFENGYLYR